MLRVISSFYSPFIFPQVVTLHQALSPAFLHLCLIRAKDRCPFPSRAAVVPWIPALPPFSPPPPLKEEEEEASTRPPPVTTVCHHHHLSDNINHHQVLR